MFRLAEDDRPAAQCLAPRDLQGGLGVHLCVRGLKLGAPAESVGSASVVESRSVSAGAQKNRVIRPADLIQATFSLALGDKLR